MSRVFVGLPTYNGAATLRRAVDSIRGQTFQDWTLWISDNASTDGTRSLAEALAAEDPRIHYHRHDSNLGAAANFRFLLERADTPYFTWFPDDYIMESRFLEVCVAALDRDVGIGTAMTNIAYANDRGRIVLLNSEAEKIVRHADRGRDLVFSYLLAQEMPVLFYAVFRTPLLRECALPHLRRRRLAAAFDCFVVLQALCRSGLAVDPGFRQILPYEDEWDQRSLTYNYLGFGTGFGLRFYWESLRVVPARWRAGAAVVLGMRWCVGIVYKLLYHTMLGGPAGLWGRLRTAFDPSGRRYARRTDERLRDG